MSATAPQLRLWTREEYYKMAEIGVFKPGERVELISGRIVEVSESTLAYDRSEKASLYASAGILDYWVLNLADCCVEVHRDPIPMSSQPYGYGYRTRAQYFANDTVTPFAAPSGTIRVADILP